MSARSRLASAPCCLSSLFPFITSGIEQAAGVMRSGLERLSYGIDRIDCHDGLHIDGVALHPQTGRFSAVEPQHTAYRIRSSPLLRCGVRLFDHVQYRYHTLSAMSAAYRRNIHHAAYWSWLTLHLPPGGCRIFRVAMIALDCWLLVCAKSTWLPCIAMAKSHRGCIMVPPGISTVPS